MAPARITERLPSSKRLNSSRESAELVGASSPDLEAARALGSGLQMVALVLGQCDGNGVFAFADKLVIVVANLMSED
jgi:hypothetical protein